MNVGFVNVAFLKPWAPADEGDPTMWAPGVTTWDAPCHTRAVHLSVIIIDERVG